MVCTLQATRGGQVRLHQRPPGSVVFGTQTPAPREWAPTCNETTMLDGASDRLPLPPGLQGASLIDLPGASTHRHPLETYVRDKGLRHATGVFIVGKDGRPTEID